jgi:hypothetical protein
MEGIINKNKMCYACTLNKGKWSRTDDRDAEPKRALRIYRINLENGTRKFKFPHVKALI